MFAKVDFDKCGELVTVIVQDVDSKEVLMQAYANKEAIELTMSTGFAHYYSRSRNELWKKGGTSGNVQKIVDVLIDCDCDSVLYVVEQSGVACHTGARSCFYRKLEV